MLYFANPSTPRIREAMGAGRLGCIVTPAQGNRIPPGASWCADNGLGPGRDGKPGKAAQLPPEEHDPAWYSWLAGRVGEAPDRCLFAVAPDVVADAAATLARSLPWLPRIRALGVPAALVAQDGLEYLPVPWDSFDVLFIGGSTEWKLGAHARQLVAEAKGRGKRVHMGRVNSGKRYRYAHAIGCDSADGTTLAMFPDKTLPDVLGWVGQDALPLG